MCLLGVEIEEISTRQVNGEKGIRLRTDFDSYLKVKFNASELWNMGGNRSLSFVCVTLCPERINARLFFCSLSFCWYQRETERGVKLPNSFKSPMAIILSLCPREPGVLKS